MSADRAFAITWTETALKLRRGAVGRRRSGDKRDMYELARKLLRQRLLR
jgi:hypothetical protein